MNIISGDFDDVDCSHAVEIAPRVWWVGQELKGEAFQCHAYLIEHGDQSVLIDPGSVLTFNGTLRKIEEIIPFSNIRYFVCHHQDPDITGALGMIDDLITRDDACIVTHWRAEVLLNHFNLKTPMWRIDSHDWALDLGGRTLKFIFTPYLHFPGAFCTFDEESGVLFSSDLFGGFGGEFSLFARDESCFDTIKAFHEHYMPGRDFIRHSLQSIEKEPLAMIAPQHGSIIPGPLVRPIIDKLRDLECGLYLMARSDTDIHRLIQLNHLLKDFMKAMVIYRDFGDMAHNILRLAKEVLPLEAIEFYVQNEKNKSIMCYSAENRYHGEEIDRPDFLPDLLHIEDNKVYKKSAPYYERIAVERAGEEKDAILLPLKTQSDGKSRGAALLILSHPMEISEELNSILDEMLIPLSVAIERENIYRMLEGERNLIYSRSIRDSLTGLYNREYMDDSVNRLIESHNRNYTDGLALIIVDIDRFKDINDTYGHGVGDEVLRTAGCTLRESLRKVDIPVRYGGDEFCFFILSRTLNESILVANRMRETIKGLDFNEGKSSFGVTISAGVALHRQHEPIDELIRRADRGLYEAKKSGRDSVRAFSEVES